MTFATIITNTEVCNTLLTHFAPCIPKVKVLGLRITVKNNTSSLPFKNKLIILGYFSDDSISTLVCTTSFVAELQSYVEAQ